VVFGDCGRAGGRQALSAAPERGTGSIFADAETATMEELNE
jgi:hypothetical protein